MKCPHCGREELEAGDFFFKIAPNVLTILSDLQMDKIDLLIADKAIRDLFFRFSAPNIKFPEMKYCEEHKENSEAFLSYISRDEECPRCKSYYYHNEAVADVKRLNNIGEES